MITYRAINTTNGKFYIGSTLNFEARKKGHLTSKENYPFQKALQKNPEAFDWEIWEDDSDEPILEQALLDMWFGKDCCYNLNPSAKHPPSWKGKSGYIWWNNGEINRRSAVCPGDGWVKGVLQKVSAERRESIRLLGKTPWWTNGVLNKRCWDSPGEDWRLGKTWDVPPVSEQFNAPWWTDGKNNKRNNECPGEGWTRGMTKNAEGKIK